jgi:ERCC4-type nuclease
VRKSVPYWLTKAQIVAAVTDSQLCQGKFAWRAVLDVAERGLIDRCVKTQRYALNAAGYALALKLAPAMPAPAALLATPLADDVSGAEVSVSTSRDQPLLDADVRGGNVLLLIDTRELTNHPRLGMLLATRGVPFESRTLTLSDMLFVMSVPRANGAPPLELVMDFAAERKELPDFMASFYDGRYREQKHRLARCGVNNVCYLVEGRLTSSVSITSTGWDPRLQKYGRYSRAIPTDAIRSAMLSTTIHDKFIVRHTETMDETADYLASVYRHVARARPMVELAETPAAALLAAERVHGGQHQGRALDSARCVCAPADAGARLLGAARRRHRRALSDRVESVRRVRQDGQRVAAFAHARRHPTRRCRAARRPAAQRRHLQGVSQRVKKENI